MDSNSILKDIGRSYIVSSFIPAGIFLASAILFLQDFAPFTLRIWLNSNETTFAEKLSVLAIIGFWIGFALYSSWNWTVDLFSGKFLGKHLGKIFSHFVSLGVDNEKVNSINRVRKIMLKGKEASKKEIEELLQKKAEALEGFNELEIYFPIVCEDFSLCKNDPEKVCIRIDYMPTRLGNLLKAMHLYSWNRYRLHADIAWPRLMNLFPPKYAQEFENSLINFGFLLNSSLLCFLLGFTCFLFVILRIPCHFIGLAQNPSMNFYTSAICAPINQPANFIQRGFSNTNELRFLFISLCFLLSGYFLYSLSVNAAKHYSLLVRSGIDLYRFELLKGWCQKLPETLEEEHTIWTKFNQYIISGNDLSRIKLNFKFLHDPSKLHTMSPDEEVISFESVSDHNEKKGNYE